MRLEVFLEEGIDGGLEHECVVDSYHSNLRLTVPAWCASASDAAVHNVIRHKEESLQELGHPSQCCGLEVLFFGEGSFEEEGDRIGYRHSTIAFSAEGICIEGLARELECANCTVHVNSQLCTIRRKLLGGCSASHGQVDPQPALGRRLRIL